MVQLTDELGKQLLSIEHHLECMNDDEQAVMEMLLKIVDEVAEGILRGQKIYGYMDLLKDNRDLAAEGDEEDRDWITYRLMELTRERLRRKAKREQANA